MSRTIRRKTLKHPTGWERDWSKAFGYDYEWASYPPYAELREGVVWRHSYFVRAYTEREKNCRKRMVHCESKHGNHRSPGRYYRHHREEEMRTHNRQELHRELTNPDHEGQYWTRPLNCWWDWS